jgi:hypothetical protein
MDEKRGNSGIEIPYWYEEPTAESSKSENHRKQKRTKRMTTSHPRTNEVPGIRQ